MVHRALCVSCVSYLYFRIFFFVFYIYSVSCSTKYISFICFNEKLNESLLTSVRIIRVSFCVFPSLDVSLRPNRLKKVWYYLRKKGQKPKRIRRAKKKNLEIVQLCVHGDVEIWVTGQTETLGTSTRTHVFSPSKLSFLIAAAAAAAKKQRKRQMYVQNSQPAYWCWNIRKIVHHMHHMGTVFARKWLLSIILSLRYTWNETVYSIGRTTNFIYLQQIRQGTKINKCMLCMQIIHGVEGRCGFTSLFEIDYFHSLGYTITGSIYLV